VHLQATVRVYINRHFHRQGFAAEALNAVLGFCFEEIGLHRMTASCDSRNLAAQRLFAMVGMRREGEFRKDLFVNGAWVNAVWHAILAEEYLNAKSEPPRQRPPKAGARPN
jgi:RimJ/RimL family protein N-acetyltransferase